MGESSPAVDICAEAAAALKINGAANHQKGKSFVQA